MRFSGCRNSRSRRNRDFLGLGGSQIRPRQPAERVATAGPLEFQITTTQPDSSLPSRLTRDAFAIANPVVIQAGTLGTSPDGTGPYRFVERVTGDHVALQANEAYWGGLPVLDGLTFRVVPDAGQRLAALAADAV